MLFIKKIHCTFNCMYFFQCNTWYIGNIICGIELSDLLTKLQGKQACSQQGMMLYYYHAIGKNIMLHQL